MQARMVFTNLCERLCLMRYDKRDHNGERITSFAVDEDAALTEMEAALEAQVAAAHVSFCAVLALMLPPCAAASRDPKLQR